jgi:hypothetical protein
MSALTAEKSGLASGGSIKLLSEVTCPHCWEKFPPQRALWVSEHVELLGDPLLGPERQQAFLPTRFTVDGDAIDARGMTCRTLACPRCHLPVPRAMVEMEPLFVSILGAPASGKSYFLTAMTWQLRQVMQLHFKVALTDADLASNRVLNECEESLFLNPNGSTVIPLGGLIRKTELQGELYDTVAYGQQPVRYPRPFMFSMQPIEGHPGGTAAGASRMLCLYDNAGEHFLPGQDTTSSPVTRHLAQSRAILFLFDTTQDTRWSAAARAGRAAGPDRRPGKMTRQETVFSEATARIRRHTAMSHGTKYDRPVIIVLPKFDEWSHMQKEDISTEPWKTQGNITGIDVERIERLSSRLRELLMQHCPEIVLSAEGFAQSVTYIAVSSLGSSVEIDPASGLAGIRPAAIKPAWAAVPLLYALSRVAPALIPRLVRKRT